MGWNPIKWVQERAEDVGEDLSGFVRGAVNVVEGVLGGVVGVVEKVGGALGKTIEGIVSNPLPTIAFFFIK